MPTSTLIKQICTSDDCDINSSQLDLSLIGMDRAFVHWYHDVNYGSDEYGCTSLPEIFHAWLIDRQGKHVNALGRECIPYWGWNMVKSLHYDRDRWYILWAGSKYTGPSRGYPFAAVIDVSDPDKPVAHVVESSREASMGCNIIANMLNNNVVFIYPSGGAPRVAVFSFDELLSSSSLDELLANALDIGEWDWAAPVGDRIFVCRGSEYAVYDYGGNKLQSGSIDYCELPIPLYYRGEPAVFIWRFTESRIIIVKEDGTVVTKSAPSYSGESWKFGVYAIGVKIFYAVEPAKKAILYDPISDAITVDIDVDCPIVSTGRPDDLICFDRVLGYAKYSKFVPDSYIKIVVNNDVAIVTDANGNPIPNRKVYMWRVSALTNYYVGIDRHYVVGTTDESGRVRIPLNGVVAIAVP